jgi:hypothetical protein
MAWTVTAHLPGCENGTCPTFWTDTETGAVRVRGADPNRPGEELDVEFSAADWATLTAQLPR